MTGNNEHQNPVLETAAELKRAYDEAYTEHATHLGILAVKQDVMEFLQTSYTSNRQATGAQPELAAGRLVAHSVNVMAAPLQRELRTAAHDVCTSTQTVETSLAKSSKHYLDNSGDYIDFARSMTPAKHRAKPLESNVA